MDPQLQQSGVFILVIFLAVMVERGWQWLRRRRARLWPVAQGTVHAASWRQPRTGTNRYFIGDLSYYYFVNGHFYAGFHRRSFSKADAADEWVKRMEGSDIQVRYKNDAPGNSLLLEEEQPTVVVAHETPTADKSELVVAGD
jgi:hypothetical protein